MVVGNGNWGYYDRSPKGSPQRHLHPLRKKAKMRGKSKDDCCFNCGSKWHQVADCPLKNSKGKGKQLYPKGNCKGKSRGKGYAGKSKSQWSWRPSHKGKGKKGKGYEGKSYGKRSWYTSTPGSASSPNFIGFEEKKNVARSLNISDGIPNSNTAISKTVNAKEYAIHTSDEEEIIKLGRIERTRSASTDDQNDENEKKTPKEKQHATAFSFASSFYGAEEYFVVKGQKRQGLIIDPGAAAGLIGSETLRELMKICVEPYGMKDRIEIEYDKTSPVSGISGSADRTLGRITVPLQTNGHDITFTGEVLGGEGSLCPPLVGNPALRKMHAVLFAEYFEDGDGLLAVDEETENAHDGQPMTKVKLFRLLLTESGHYLLATDDAQKSKIPSGTKQEVSNFFNRVASQATQQWTDVCARMKHCFLASRTAPTEGDRGEVEVSPNAQINNEKNSTPPLQTSSTSTMDTKNVKAEKPSDEGDQQVSPSGILPQSEASAEALQEPKLGSTPTESGQMTETFPPAHLEQHVINDDIEFNEHQQPCGDACDGAHQFHSEEDFPKYSLDVLPDDMDHNKLNKRYKAIPEEFYTKSGLRPVTPKNFKRWFNMARGRGLRWHFWELCSGSGRLSLTLLLAGLTIGFPVDARYGWNLGNINHQNMLDLARKEFQPGFIHHAPDCGPWSVSSNTKDPETKHLERLQEQPTLNWIQRSCEDQSRGGRGYSVEQPLGSAMWRDDNESTLRLDKIHDNRAKQRCDQCMHDLRDEKGLFIQKATGLGSNAKFTKTAIRCSGHRGQAHAHLQGQAPNGLLRTAMAAVYPRTMCQRMKYDIIQFLNKRNLMKIKSWPSDLAWFTTQSFYECVRCTLGRACPKDIEHSMIPGQCRHGKWATGTNPRINKLEDKDPLLRWKDTTNKENFEQIIVENQTEKELTVAGSHYIKKLLMDVVNSALGLFGEASQRKIEYIHWIENAISMALFKEIFQEHMMVKAIKVELRPFHKSAADPKVVTSTAYLRIHITGNVKHWILHPMEDLRELSMNQINEAVECDEWMITVFGQDVGSLPAPSTPTSRPRRIPPQPDLPAKTDDAEILARIQERPEDPQVPALQDGVYEEEFDAHDRKDLAPIKPNYNLRRVLLKLPGLVEAGDLTKAKRLLLGMHERLWHSPISDFTNLLRRSGQPTEVIQLAREAVLSCAICRKYIRLPNRPQLRARGANSFNQVIQIDLFKFDERWHLIMIDEATRFKLCDVVEGQESEQLLHCLLRNWTYMFGPPEKVTMDQQMSLMGHETGAEFERLGMERNPKGTTAGQGAEQHTGTGMVERHVQLLKLTMYKLRAELSRQGIVFEPEDLCRESAMSHNITLSYGGSTPAMSVLGILPRGFYEPESGGILSASGASDTDITPFEKAIRIRQTALAQTQQAIIEDRVARASRTRPHQLPLDQLIPGTSEVEFCREVQGDPGWRGPALLLRLDADEGTAVIQYQGKPYLVALRHVRPYRGIFHVNLPKEETQASLNQLMRYVESLSDYKLYTYGWLAETEERLMGQTAKG